MVSVVTLHVNDCANNSNLAGASVTDGVNVVYTNSYGETLVYFDDPVGYGVNVGKSGYNTRYVAVYATQSGSTVTVCLDRAASGGGGTGGSGGGASWSCFIVSAATGSPESEDVVALRALRDRVTARSAAAGALIEAMYDEYWQFSPAVAAEIAGDPLLRQGALSAAVRPLVAWYTLAGTLAFSPDDGAAIAAGRQALVEACPQWIGPANLAALIATMRRDRIVPDEAPETLRSLAPHLARAASLPLVDWAMLRPLQACWEGAASGLDPVRQIADWLADAPFDQVAALPDTDHAEHTVAAGSLLGFAPDAQSRLMTRLQRALAGRATAAGRGCGCAKR